MVTRFDSTRYFGAQEKGEAGGDHLSGHITKAHPLVLGRGRQHGHCIEHEWHEMVEVGAILFDPLYLRRRLVVLQVGVSTLNDL